MPPSDRHDDSADQRLERVLGGLLRWGVLLSAAVVFAGMLIYLARHAAEKVNYAVFASEPADLRSPWGIVTDALSFRGRGMIQLGLLLLIATPVMRVVFSLAAFIWQRDRTYVVVTSIVLAVLLYSLAGAN